MPDPAPPPVFRAAAGRRHITAWPVVRHGQPPTVAIAGVLPATFTPQTAREFAWQVLAAAGHADTADQRLPHPPERTDP